MGNSDQNLLDEKNILKKEVKKIPYVLLLPWRREGKEMPTLCRLASRVTTAVLAGSRTKGHSDEA